MEGRDRFSRTGRTLARGTRTRRARGIKIKNEIARNFQVIPIDEGRLSIGLHRSFTL